MQRRAPVRWQGEPVNEYGSLERQCTHKRWYRTRRHAKLGAQESRERYGVALEPYRCQICEGWHLTTKEAAHG